MAEKNEKGNPFVVDSTYTSIETRQVDIPEIDDTTTKDDIIDKLNSKKATGHSNSTSSSMFDSASILKGLKRAIRGATNISGKND